MADKETRVIVSADTSKFERAMNRVQAIDSKLSREMQYRWNKIKNVFSGVLGQVVALAGVGGMVMLAKSTVDAASALEEVSSKFSVVFKGQEKIAEEWSKELVKSYAMSTREAKQYLSSVQDLLVPMGMQADAAGRMSNEVVKLSADLGSFNNLPTAQVMGDIQSALVGNFETMKKYGVVLNETVVKQKALDMGLWQGKGTLDANTKAQVAFKLMLEGSAAAIGDMDRTSEGYANQLKKLTAQIEDTKAAIGEGLLPVLTPMVKNMNTWLTANKALIGLEFKEWLDAVNPVFKVFAATASLVAQGAAGIGLIIKSFGNITPYFDKSIIPDKLAPSHGPGYTPRIQQKTEQAEKELGVDAAYKARALELELTHNNYLLKFHEQRAADLAIINKKISDNEIKTAQYTQEQKLGFYEAAAGNIAGTFLQIAQAGGKQSKEAFALYKAFAIIQATMAAHAAIVGALGSPPYGISAIVLAASIGAMASTQVAMIAAAQPPSYDQGGISRAKGVYQTGNIDEAHIPLRGGKVPVSLEGGGQTFIINMENPVFQDVATQRQVFAQIAEVVAKRVAPGAVVQNYRNDGEVRSMVRGNM